MNAIGKAVRNVLGATAMVASAVVPAQNLFRGLDTTAGGYQTWDSDLINIELVPQTGRGVYVAVLDTGMVPNWRDYFPEARVATHLGAGFFQPVSFKAKGNECGLAADFGRLQTSTWVGGDSITHGTHVASTILGYSYRANADAAAGYVLPPIVVRGIAPEVTVIPIRVLADYKVPALPKCDPALPAGTTQFGTDEMIAAGIRYATDLKRAGYSPMVINMSLGGSELVDVEKEALDYAIANGVIVVAAAGNSGEAGMGYPAAYPPVISAGSIGWVGEWLNPTDGQPRYRLWWLQDNASSMLTPPLPPGSGQVADATAASDLYVSDFSSRALPGQELDVLAPGSWVRGPIPIDAGYSHLPWWSKGIGDLVGRAGTNFRYIGGTSMASPHVASVAALMLQKNPKLTQSQVEKILKGNTLALPPAGSRYLYGGFDWATITWDTMCESVPCDAVGAGVLQADQALASTPTP
jgi:subtilisin family serine protease